MKWPTRAHKETNYVMNARYKSTSCILIKETLYRAFNNTFQDHMILYDFIKFHFLVISSFFAVTLPFSMRLCSHTCIYFFVEKLQ